jgi:hypothetical protein
VNGSGPSNGLPPEAIGAAVSRVLSSDAFTNSKRLQRFLAYIVEKTLTGETDEVKEYNIALTVFDREPSFDPRLDSIVRVEARRLRQQLGTYYQGDGQRDPVVIELPKGSYLPVFHNRNGARPGDEATAAPAAVEKRVVSKHSRRIEFLALAAMALLAVKAATLWWGGYTPYQGRVEGSTLRIFDDRGRLCWEKPLPPLNPDYYFYARDQVVVADIDGDRQPEVLFNLRPQSHGEKSGSLLCFDGAGNLRWESAFGGRKTFRGRTFDPAFGGRFVRPMHARGKRYLLTVANHNIWYPAQVALLDPASGRVVEEYWHPGSIYEIAPLDVDHDGEAELLFGAINNPGDGLGHAAIGILKLPFSAAPRPPVQAEDPFPPATGGGEINYALLPLPDVSRVMGTLPILSRFAVDQNRRILMQVPLADEGGIVYYFDTGLNVIEYRASDNFEALHERYYRQGLLDHRLTPAEVASLGKVVRFAAAPDGNSPELRRLWKF